VLLVESSAAQVVIAGTALPPPTPAGDPLRFIFPSDGPAPVSAWRPPLYSIPWVPTTHDHFMFARPISANEINWPLADYRYGGVFLPGVVHTGIDIPAPSGTPVLASGSGRVAWAGYGLYTGKNDPNDPYGLAVAIRHDFGYQSQTLFTIYGHMQEVEVMLGQQVESGQLIGKVGETGKVTGPHLHFEVRVGDNSFHMSRNPELWIAPPIGWGVLAARITDTSGFPLVGQEIQVFANSGSNSWTVRTYGEGPVISDLFYNENLVLGDLPAGDYTIWVPFAGTTYDLEVSIAPGLVTYFTFKGRQGFRTELPATPEAGFTPPPTP
jgi:murein DD-endopeptidase MepM/ murein hydrolase activator NlpD